MMRTNLVLELADTHALEVEERLGAYLFRAPAWRGQVLRMSATVTSYPPNEVRAGFARAIAAMPLPDEYAGLHFKGFAERGNIDAYKLREEHRAKLEA